MGSVFVFCHPDIIKTILRLNTKEIYEKYQKRKKNLLNSSLLLKQGVFKCVSLKLF